MVKTLTLTEHEMRWQISNRGRDWRNRHIPHDTQRRSACDHQYRSGLTRYLSEPDVALNHAAPTEGGYHSFQSSASIIAVAAAVDQTCSESS